jgi:hypothetical protein
VCPVSAEPGGACSDDGLTCDYPPDGGCGGSDCTCENGQWACIANGCPLCPTFPPGSGTGCMPVGEECEYSINGSCDEEVCNCGASATWSCAYSKNCESDGGFVDSGI